MHLTHSSMPSTSWQYFFPLMAQIMVHHRYQRHFRFDETDRYLIGSREVRHPRQRDWHVQKHRGGFPAGLAVESLPARAGPAEQVSPWPGEIPHAATPEAGTAEPASVTRSRGPQPERSPRPLHQRRPQAAVKAQLSQQKEFKQSSTEARRDTPHAGAGRGLGNRGTMGRAEATHGNCPAVGLLAQSSCFPGGNCGNIRGMRAFLRGHSFR